MSANYWVFSNKSPGYYDEQDWDMNTIFETKNYYFKRRERNRSNISEGDVAYMRIYGDSYIGKFEIGKWIDDPKSQKKYGKQCGSFKIKNLELWQRSLPQGLIIRDLSNGDIRSRIISINKEDTIAIETAQKTYARLGFGGADGEIVVLEKGIEEAIKPNLESLGLRLANEEIQQQFSMGPDIGRSDLICTDDNNNLVVIELKRGATSDEVIGQILRYVGYVQENIAEDKQKVKGWIVTGDYDEHLRLAASAAEIKLILVKLQ